MPNPNPILILVPQCTLCRVLLQREARTILMLAFLLTAFAEALLAFASSATGLIIGILYGGCRFLSVAAAGEQS